MKIILLSASVGSGKTTALAKAVSGDGLVGGILQPKGANGRELIDIATGEGERLEQPEAGEREVAVGRYVFRQAAFDWANDRLAGVTRPVVLIDEVGPLELRDGGLHEGVAAVLRGAAGLVVIAVREALTEAVRGRYAPAAESVALVGWPQMWQSVRGAL